ncbi:hypothetical protein [Streptomyces griseorubiginosus]
MHDDPVAEPVGQRLAQRLATGHGHRTVRDEPHQVPRAAGHRGPELGDLLQCQGGGGPRAAEHDAQQLRIRGQQVEETLPLP